MSKLPSLIVDHRKAILAAFLALTLCCAWMITKVTINYDMTKYLPENSAVREGIDVMNSRFTEANSLNIMFKDLSGDEKEKILAELKEIEFVQNVLFESGSERYEKDGYTLYNIAIASGPYTDETKKVIDDIKERYGAYEISMSGESVRNDMLNKLTMIFAIAFGILLVILFLMCNSWIEPLIFFADIAIAILINMGTNLIFDSVSDITNSIAAVLQVCLSMDYSIMLLNRYRLEKKSEPSNAKAMKKALANSFTSVTSSSVTTIVGMLVLVFMSFTIGRDLGLVLAKGVFISLLCIFSVLPAFILMCDTLIVKTAKKPLPLKMDAIASVGYKARYFVTGAFIVLFTIGFLLRNNVVITYTMTEFVDISKVFTLNNQVVVLYENKDEENAALLAAKWGEYPFVDNVNAYSTTIGKKLTNDELAEIIGMDVSAVRQFYVYYALVGGGSPQDGITMYDFMRVLTDETTAKQFGRFIDDEARTMLESAKHEMDKAMEQFVGEDYSRIIINTGLSGESEETFGFIRDIERDLNETLSGSHYILGNSAMAYEMSNTFPDEMNFITVLTALSIFLVIAIAFRSLSVPVILVCIIQCAVFITMGSGRSIFYLPLIIVQCLLMGSTIDYGILYSSFYRESRKTMDIKTSVTTSLNNSIHTILTSGLILIVVTLVLGISLTNSDHAVSEILLTISRGGCFSVAVVVFILPGLMAVMDRFTSGIKK